MCSRSRITGVLRRTTPSGLPVTTRNSNPSSANPLPEASGQAYVIQLLRVLMDDFDSVSWRNEDSNDSRPNTAGKGDAQDRNSSPRSNGKRKAGQATPQAGEDAQAIDIAGIGEHGRLDCTVSSPLKEHDGTKDAYVSYLVTTDVCMSTTKTSKQSEASTADVPILD